LFLVKNGSTIHILDPDPDSEEELMMDPTELALESLIMSSSSAGESKEKTLMATTTGTPNFFAFSIYKKQSFGFGSMWIRIVMAPVDPDQDPYREYGSGSRREKMTPKKEIIQNFKLKRV